MSGRDVEQIIRDLVEISLTMTRERIAPGSDPPRPS